MEGFSGIFSRLADPRTGNARRHDLYEVLMIALCSCLCGGTTCTEMAEFAQDKEPFLRDFLALKNGLLSVDPDNGSIDHLVLEVGVSRHDLENARDHAFASPTPKSLKHRIPLTENFRQVSPRSADPGDLENRLRNQPIIGPWPTWIADRSPQVRSQTLPLFVRQHRATHGDLLVGGLESFEPCPKLFDCTRMSIGSSARLGRLAYGAADSSMIRQRAYARQ